MTDIDRGRMTPTRRALTVAGVATIAFSLVLSIGPVLAAPGDNGNAGNGNAANGNSGTATVTDLSGKVVYTQSLQSQSGTLYIETYAWAKGAYMISLTDENGMGARRKIVVQ